jgi:hypothetical protein
VFHATEFNEKKSLIKEETRLSGRALLPYFPQVHFFPLPCFGNIKDSTQGPPFFLQRQSGQNDW